MIVLESHDHVRNQHDIGHESCKTTSVGGIAFAPSVTHVHYRSAKLTSKDEVDGEEVRANGQRDHSKRKAHQLEDDGTKSL